MSMNESNSLYPENYLHDTKPEGISFTRWNRSYNSVYIKVLDTITEEVINNRTSRIYTSDRTSEELAIEIFQSIPALGLGEKTVRFAKISAAVTVGASLGILANSIGIDMYPEAYYFPALGALASGCLYASDEIYQGRKRSADVLEFASTYNDATLAELRIEQAEKSRSIVDIDIDLAQHLSAQILDVYSAGMQNLPSQ